jgi:AcrR family transcriptional regulator
MTEPFRGFIGLPASALENRSEPAVCAIRMLYTVVQGPGSTTACFGGREARRGALSARGTVARATVGEIHRQRMLVAMAEAVHERGVGAVSVAEVVSRAGVSRRTFYEAFDDRDDCLLAALDYAFERAERLTLAAWRSHPRWRDATRASLAALLGFLDEEPVLGAVLVLDWAAARGVAAERRASVVAQLVDAVDGGRELCRPGREPSPLTAEGLVGAVLAVVQSRLTRPPAGRGSPAPEMSEMLGELMAIVVLPYLGPSAAAREASRPAPEPPPRRAHASTDALRGLKIRLTYRTVMVLRFVGSRPGSSNREIAAGAGIADQGQVSKLLTRLAKAGLVENERRLETARDCNAWSLTATGAAVERATSREDIARPLPG